MSGQKTHRYVSEPRIGVRYLADYMVASEIARRRIVRDSKYRPIGRILQHAEARSAVSKFIRDGGSDIGWLEEEAQRLRDRLVDSDFERDVVDHNADYIERFSKVFGLLSLPKAQLLIPGPDAALDINGVRVTVGLHLRLRRRTKTNKIQEGAGMLRYAKGKKLSPDVGLWQSAFLLGYLRASSVDSDVQPDEKLCIMIDAYTGSCHVAPTNSLSRFQNMSAACESIAERWPNIQPPAGAVF
jgi:hypothetical protein